MTLYYADKSVTLWHGDAHDEEYAGQTGVVIDVPDRYFNAFDVCVEMDNARHRQRCFMVDELQVQP